MYGNYAFQCKNRDLSKVDKAINHCLIFMLTLCPCKIGLFPCPTISQFGPTHVDSSLVHVFQLFGGASGVKVSDLYHIKSDRRKLLFPWQVPSRRPRRNADSAGPISFNSSALTSTDPSICIVWPKRIRTITRPLDSIAFAQQQRFSIPIANKPFTLFPDSEVLHNTPKRREIIEIY